MDDIFDYLALIGLIILFLLALIIPCCIQCNKKAAFLNKKFGTDYRAGDMFWNGDTIEKVLVTQNLKVTVKKS